MSLKISHEFYRELLKIVFLFKYDSGMNCGHVQTIDDSTTLAGVVLFQIRRNGQLPKGQLIKSQPNEHKVLVDVFGKLTFMQS
jgi:hypothetical protein